MSEEEKAKWVQTFRKIWHEYRKPAQDSEWDCFNWRNEMRWNGWRYAGMRGWQVALTPPQRRKVKK